ncbi:MAG TPA: flippase [Ignavibacteriaceae bacterium]|nr:flippase [Ignavibacteriaceae bacterium]
MNWQKIRKDLLLAGTSQFIYKVIGYFIITILTRYLAKDEMGEFFFAASLATFFSLVTEAGTSRYLVREVASKPKEALRYFSEVISLRLPLSALYIFIINGFTLLFKPDIAEVVLLTSIYVLLEQFYFSFGSLFMGLKKIKYNFIAGVSTRILLVGFIVLAVKLEGSLTLIIICYLFANALLIVVSFLIVWSKIGLPKLIWQIDPLKKILKNSFPFFVLTLLSLIHFKIDSVMLGFMKSYSLVATYEAAYKLLEASVFLIRPADMIFFPLFTEMVSRKNWPEIQKIFGKMLKVSCFLGSFIALVVIIFAGSIIPAVFGSKYHDSILILQVLFLYVPIRYAGLVIATLANSIYLEKKLIKITLISAIINICLNLRVIPPWGALGAAIATLVSGAAATIWSTALVFRKLGVEQSGDSLNEMRHRIEAN